MEEVLERADKEGVWCYLESSRREPNVPIYERFGFKLAKEMECGDGGEEEGRITLYCMLREPRNVGDESEHGQAGGKAGGATDPVPEAVPEAL